MKKTPLRTATAILGLSLSALASSALAGNITMTTYYPSPTGNYDSLSANNLTVSGSVGIGTIHPQKPLSVDGNINVDQGDHDIGASGLNIYHGISFGSTSGESIGSNRDPSNPNLYGLDFYTLWAKRMSITSGGNVGIGTTNPQAPLHVVGNTQLQGGQIVFSTPNSDLNGTTGIVANRNGWSRLDPNGSRFIMTVTADQVAAQSNILDIERTDTWQHLLELRADGSIFVNNAIGIGTTAPVKKLEVFGDDALINGVTIGKGAGAIVDNTVLGSLALTANTTGYFNTSIGHQTLTSNTTGGLNTAVGGHSLHNNTTGLYNTAIGVRALSGNTTGKENTALGLSALERNTTGESNTAIGYSAFSGNATGSYNIAIGLNAGGSLPDGNYNTDSSRSIFIGMNTQANGATDSNEIVIGADATGLGSNTVLLGNSSIITTALSGNVSIGTTTPDSKLTLKQTTDGSRGLNVTTTTGTPLSLTTNNGTVNFSTSSSEPTLGAGGSTSNVYLTIDQPVYISGFHTNGSNKFALYLLGDINASGYYHASDERLKQNIKPIANALDKIQAISGVTFAFKSSPRKNEIGVIAQNVEKVVPEVVATGSDGMKSVEYGNLVGLLIEGIKDQQKQIAHQNDLIAGLQKQINALKK